LALELHIACRFLLTQEGHRLRQAGERLDHPIPPDLLRPFGLPRSYRLKDRDDAVGWLIRGNEQSATKKRVNEGRFA
jgi:hypothetical protein